jgi:hypothetical protein
MTFFFSTFNKFSKHENRNFISQFEEIEDFNWISVIIIEDNKLNNKICQ